MKILLSEEQMASYVLEQINEYNIYDGNADNNPYAKKVDSDTELLKRLISMYGVPMNNIENGKEYIVYEIVSLSKIIGRRYGICQLKDEKTGKARGIIYVRPLSVFKLKNY